MGQKVVALYEKSHCVAKMLRVAFFGLGWVKWHQEQTKKEKKRERKEAFAICFNIMYCDTTTQDKKITVIISLIQIDYLSQWRIQLTQLTLPQ